MPYPVIRVAIVSLCLVATSCGAETTVIRNPLRHDRDDEAVRISLPEEATTVVVRAGDQVLPHQIETWADRPELWTRVTVPAESAVEISAQPGPASPVSPDPLWIREQDRVIELGNDLITLRIPATTAWQAGQPPPPPVLAISQTDGPWLGQGGWRAAPTCTGYRATIIGRGPVQISILQEWTFADGGHLRLRLRLRPGRPEAIIEERFDQLGEAAWTFDAAHGWTPQDSLYTQHGGGAGRPFSSNVKEGTLLPGQTRMGHTLVHLLPRWSQAMDDGWCAAAADDQFAVGAVTVRAGQWQWPHDARLGIELADGGNQMLIVAPLQRGARMWWLRAAPREAWQTGALRGAQQRWGMGCLDKLNQLYILDWPEVGGRAGLPDPFDGGNVNPTGHWRQQARGQRRETGRPGNIGHLIRLQAILDPDYYGTPLYGWSTQNPNFWTDVLQVPALLATRVTAHPRFEEIRHLVHLALRLDLHHGITLPGGAGQECPGYQAHAHQVWARTAEAVEEHLGFDLREDERYQAGLDFLIRSSQPDGTQRRMLPTGDTHPGRDGPRVMELGDHDPRTWTSEEFPGFGAILRHRCGSPQETFVAFKAGPNRGHYHGDQLAIHWCHEAQPLAVDHHCSYSPRAGQEHMHNRLSFGTEQMPWANMDGYERLIALTTTDAADIAIAEVASTRLRRMRQLPPEEWDQRWDVQPLGGTLRYRRALILVKVLDRDVLILVDDWQGPQALDVTFNLHVRAEDGQAPDPQRFRFDQDLSVWRARPDQAVLNRLDWRHENGGGEATVGLRWTHNAASGRFLTVLWPGPELPPVSATDTGLRLADVSVSLAAPFADDGPQVVISRGGSTLAQVDSVDKDRHQGEVGLFVPDAGYPFGDIPAWLGAQRLARPPWAKQLPRLLDPMEEW